MQENGLTYQLDFKHQAVKTTIHYYEVDPINVFLLKRKRSFTFIETETKRDLLKLRDLYFSASLSICSCAFV